MGGVEKGVGRRWAGLEGELGLVVKDSVRDGSLENMAELRVKGLEVIG